MNALLQRDLPEDEVWSPVHVEKAVLHIVDHKGRSKPVLSAAEISLGADPRLQSYFDDQVLNALRDPAIAKARFVDVSPGVAGSCYEILEDPEAFIPGSRQLAEALWEATGSDQRISSGSLVVCLCRAEDGPTPLLALLKIDPTDVLLQKVTRRPGGEIVEVTVVENGLPTANERLQKAAVVLPRGGKQKHHLLLLDRLGKVAAEYFTRGFLGAAPILTARERTEYFYFGAKKAYDQLAQPKAPEQPLLDPAQADRLRRAIDSALALPRLDVGRWIEDLELPEPAKDVLGAEIDRQLDTREFAVDTGYAEKSFRRKRLRGDRDILIEFDGAFEEQVFRVDEIFQRDGVEVTRVVLEVPNLRWVKV
jgi:hypothetical protein